MDFFDVHDHDWLILVGLTICPRITLLFMGGPFAWFQWVGWFFVPHVMVAIMATITYWDTNPILVAIAWILALSGSSAEGQAGKRVGKKFRKAVKKKPATPSAPPKVAFQVWMPPSNSSW